MLRVEGTVADGFEPVRELFERQMRVLAEDNAQLCVYVGDEQVVDLWGTTTGDDTFGADSLVNIFSSGKSLESVALAWLVQQGLLDYNAKITAYWPEFGGKGKDALTVADLMRHEAGLAAFDVSLSPEDLLTENIKQNRVGAVIESHAPAFRADASRRREYHGLTRGWIVNELFRRVDPAGRTIGEFLRESLPGTDVFIGVPESELDRIAPGRLLGPGRYLRETLRPGGRRGVSEGFLDFAGKVREMVPSARERTTRGKPAPFEGLKVIGAFNDPRIARGETPSANTHASARGLAKLAAGLSRNGAMPDGELLAPDAWQAMHDAPVRSNMGIYTTFTQGGVAKFDMPISSSRLERKLNVGREGYYGWMGLGGSIFQWHPEKQIGFAFVPTSLHVLDFVNERGKVYQELVSRLVDRRS